MQGLQISIYSHDHGKWRRAKRAEDSAHKHGLKPFKGASWRLVQATKLGLELSRFVFHGRVQIWLVGPVERSPTMKLVLLILFLQLRLQTNTASRLVLRGSSVKTGSCEHEFYAAPACPEQRVKTRRSGCALLDLATERPS